jgi:hypothetical protein
MGDEQKSTGLLAVKDFFEFKSTATFREEWSKLSLEEQEYFKKAVAEGLIRRKLAGE